MNYFSIINYCFSGTSTLIPFLPVYANKNLLLSFTGIGLVYTILPFVGFLAKSLSGTIADKLNAHKKVFFLDLIACAIGFFRLVVLL